MNSQNGRDMDSLAEGSVRRARERAAAGLPSQPYPPTRSALGRMDNEPPPMARPSVPRQPAITPTAGSASRGPRSQVTYPRPANEQPIGIAISRPMPVPQWPLQESIPAAPVVDEPYRPPTAESRAPERPQRPSRVPLIQDSSKVQEPTPVFQYPPSSLRDRASPDYRGTPETPSSFSRPPSTISSVASLSDFPLPVQITTGPPRRSVNLGPPPSSRRGASSFYSTTSYVSPIPEESPRSRSRTSFASSAAMPDNWGTPSPGPSPDYPDPAYAEAIAEESDDDERGLVRSASVGRKAKPTLVTGGASGNPAGVNGNELPVPPPGQTGPLKDGTGYIEGSSDSGLQQSLARVPTGSAVSTDTTSNANSSANGQDQSSNSSLPTSNFTEPAGGRGYSRLSAIRRPPRLDMEAVRNAEARGSLTSLPELIRRATRLAASLEKGRRPASRFGDLDDMPPWTNENNSRSNVEKHQSGISDMLAAFPPPANPAATTTRDRRSLRESVKGLSWPSPFGINRTVTTSHEAVSNNSSERGGERRRRRRYCGLPIWAFILVIIVIIILVVAAIALPIQFFVLKKPAADGAQAAIQECQQQLMCRNGGTNVLNNGVCSCLCVNGWTGADCSVFDPVGCVTFPLQGTDATVRNVTVGDAIPRLIEQAQANFSVPLSADTILMKLDAGGLSCSAENALVTFNGHSTRQASSSIQAVVPDGVNAAVIDGVLFTTITVIAFPFTTFTLTPGVTATTIRTTVTGNLGTTLSLTIIRPTTTSTSFSPTPTATRTIMTTTTSSLSSGDPMPTSVPGGNVFTVTEDRLDFARVAVLYVLQEVTIDAAETAQQSLQRFFTAAEGSRLGGSGTENSDGRSSSSPASGVSLEQARNVTIGEGRTVDLVGFVIDLGDGRRVGSGMG